MNLSPTALFELLAAAARAGLVATDFGPLGLKVGKKAFIALREPSLGPVFGVKGGAAGARGTAFCSQY